ncbi:uncharacterized protein LOC121391442 [Gigantopelta aegis]|uniref:uncharacterized protein LOC121391442 n=1 Tax=Gigantopelta aegis TaxID=1735272 RepID=UPI001B88DA93|nr:uncharacterized protein LOC121391442 [Gigantopelta aegis]
MVTVPALSFLVAAMAMAVNAGPMDFFKNWQIAYKCPRDFVKSKFHYYAPYVNHVQVLLDLQAVDKDNNDDITASELADLSPLNFNLRTGVSRCEYVKTYGERYGLKPVIASFLFTDADVNKDGVFTTADVTMPRVDKNGDGKNSVCEFYNAFLGIIDLAGKDDYDRKKQIRQIKADTDHYNDKNAKDWLGMFWHFFKNWN